VPPFPVVDQPLHPLYLPILAAILTMVLATAALEWTSTQRCAARPLAPFIDTRHRRAAWVGGPGLA
jgi:hypothetical protein